YGDDQGKVAATTGYHACRVYIDKPITLKSSGGRDVTHLVGNYVEGASTSADAVGGVVIAKAAAAGTVVRGFTIRRCGTSKLGNGSNPNGGAAVYCKLDAATAMAGMPWVADCAIDDCYSCRAALKYVNVARTIITHCRATAVPTVADYCNLAWCAVAHNGVLTLDCHLLRGTKGDGATANHVINCTIQDNARNGTSTTAPRYICNTIFRQGGIYSPILRNSVFSNGRDGMGNASNPTDVSSTNATATSVFSKADGVTAGTAVNDFRLVKATTLANKEVADSPALDVGDAALLDVLPEEYRWTDCYGHAVTPVDGKIHAGAVQETMTPAAAISFSSDNTSCISVNGVHGVANIAQTVYTDTWPVCYDLQADDAATLAAASLKPFFGYLVQGGSVPDRYVFPDANERVPFVPENGRAMTLTFCLATHVVYVDAAAEDGNADTGAGTEAEPYARIQAALDAVPNSTANRAVVYVAPGTYSAGGTVHGGLNPNSRVYVSHGDTRYRVIGTGGAANTVIAGEADPDAPAAWQGCSTNAVRCIRTSEGCFIAFQGFTLTGGHSAGGETGIGSGNSYGRGGALQGQNTERTWLVECIVTNNVAYWAGGAFANGVAVKCSFADNRVVKGGGVFSPQNNVDKGREILTSCVVDQPGMLFDTHTGVMVVNSTLRATPSTKILSGADGDFFNSILVDSAASTAGDTSKRMMGNVIWNYDYKGAAARNAEGVNYVKADPLFVDAAGGDFHVCSGSPAVGGGTAWDGLDASVWSATVAYSNYYRHIHCDMDGNMPYFVNGKPTAGAYQVPGKANVTLDAKGAALTSTAVGSVDWGTAVTVTASGGVRQALGISVNGEVMEGVMSYTFTTSPDDHANGYAIAAVVNTNWYVDAEHGTAGATGWSADAALDTLEHVMARAARGDTVYALPGNYAAGSMIHTNLVYSLWYSKTNATPLLPARVVVPAGVRLVSTDGAAATFITGEKAATSDGVGEGAMRCVLMEKGAYLNGFTVTGGGTLDGDTAYQYEVFDNVSGGGILCAEKPSAPGSGLAAVPVTIVEDCIVSNNCGGGTSAALFGSYVHCLFTQNRSSYYTIREPQWIYGCAFDENIAGNYAVYQPYYTDFCTFGANNRNAGGMEKPALYVYPGSAFWPVRNSLFLGGARPTVKWVYNCVVPSEGFIASNANGVATWENVVVGATAVDASWRPTACNAGAVDAAGDPAAAANACFRYAIPDVLLRNTDFAGGQRVYNGAQDVGAGELDWRDRYRQDIGGGLRLAVEEAGADVTEAAHGVQLADGATLTVAWALHGSSNKCEYVVALDGGGTLYLSVNGGEEMAVTVAGTQTLHLPAGENSLAFRYAGAGTATLSDFADFAGTMLLFR
ncbi:MAG: hypothetical protein IJI36_15120, partial [Kiritimatiellae bacterium]|nr:hypothetical protein [Kiritimatiellia bacterium]